MTDVGIVGTAFMAVLFCGMMESVLAVTALILSSDCM